MFGATHASAAPRVESLRTGDEGALPDTLRGTRIVGGNFTNDSKYPWQALLYIESSEGTFICGGSLIHPLIVITAAHCLTDEFGKFLPGLEVFVLLGDTELFEANEVHEAVGGVVNPSYDPAIHPSAPFANDAALLALGTPSSLSRILIAGPDERALWKAGRDAYVSGWGTTTEGGEISEILKEARTPIIDDATCGQPTANGPFFVASVMVCAGYLAGGEDTCQGDSGGPLESPIDGGGFRLTGLTSWGIGCARPGKPGVYSRIAADPLLQFVRQGVSVLENALAFPPQYKGISVIGSGARPPGCGAAEQALAVATQAANSATTAEKRAAKAERSSTRSLKRTGKLVRTASRALRRASKPADVAKATKLLAKARSRQRKVARRARAAHGRHAKTHAKAAQASAALSAAAAQQSATCS